MASRAYHSAAGTADETAADSRKILTGFNVMEAEATGTEAEVKIRDGTTASDPVVLTVTLAAQETVVEWADDTGVVCRNGVFIERVAGTTEVVLYLR